MELEQQDSGAAAIDIASPQCYVYWARVAGELCMQHAHQLRSMQLPIDHELER
jgi:hypothetical protein